MVLGKKGKCLSRAVAEEFRGGPFGENYSLIWQDHFGKGRDTMRHLIDPLDFTREETDRLLTLAEQILANPADWPAISAKEETIITVCAGEKFWPPCFMSPAPAPASALSPP